MIRRPPRSTRTDNSFPTRRSSDLDFLCRAVSGEIAAAVGDAMAWPGATPDRSSPGDHSHPALLRSEEHTSELQSLMRISYAVFCLKKKNKTYYTNINARTTKTHTQLTQSYNDNRQQTQQYM